MCIFSNYVRSVSDTNIFGRLSGQGTQFLIYSMKYSSDRPVAMILPLPVASPERRLGIRFINLKSYSDFFNDMENGFPQMVMPAGAGGMNVAASAAARPLIHVESVGDFIASYVPTLDDFDRLDPRFRLPRSIWNQIPIYADYGFAVFQLKKAALPKPPPGNPRSPASTYIGGQNAISRVQSMAFEFHTRLSDTLYFPTVHIHDERVHPVEQFDHALFFQDARLRPDGRPAHVSGPVRPYFWNSIDGSLRPSNHSANVFLEWQKTQGAVNPGALCYKLNLNGPLPNKDTLIRVA